MGGAEACGQSQEASEAAEASRIKGMRTPLLRSVSKGLKAASAEVIGPLVAGSGHVRNLEVHTVCRAPRGEKADKY